MQAIPFRLYFDLAPDSHADIEAFGKAAIQLSLLAKEIAFVCDPTATVRIELLHGDQSSLDTKALLKLILSKADLEQITVTTVLALIISFIIATGVDVAKTLVIDHIKGTEIHLTDTDINEIAEKLAEKQRNPVAEDYAKKFYQELSRDSAVVGVGITARPEGRPEFIVPRQQMELRARETTEETATKRTREGPATVQLLAPFLADQKRRWKLSGSEGEFGASIQDEAFVERALSGQLGIPFMAGIRMNILLQTKEELKSGVWKITERNVLKVYSIQPPQTQGALGLTSTGAGVILSPPNPRESPKNNTNPSDAKK